MVNTMAKERTFVMIKPDAVQRGLIGDIITRFEQKGKPFFEPTVSYITSSPVVAMVLEGEQVIEMVRRMMGKTNPLEASQGTIRGDFGQFIGRNIVHGADGPETAEFEINLWFSPKELATYTRIDEAWMTE